MGNLNRVSTLSSFNCGDVLCYYDNNSRLQQFIVRKHDFSNNSVSLEVTGIDNTTYKLPVTNLLSLLKSNNLYKKTLLDADIMKESAEVFRFYFEGKRKSFLRLNSGCNWLAKQIIKKKYGGSTTEYINKFDKIKPVGCLTNRLSKILRKRYKVNRV